MAAVRATKLCRRKAAIFRRKSGRADLTEKLSFRAIVFVQEGLRCIAAGAGAVIRDVTLRTAADGTYLLAITFFEVRDQFLVSPVLSEVGDKGKFINFELLVFRRVGIIESPLLKRNISADKENQPAVLLIKILNN